MLSSVTRRQRMLLLGVLLIVVGLTLGWIARGWSAPQVLVGSGYVGDDVATLFVGEDAYGLRASVTWTDAHGSYHASGWPECLPHLREVSGVRFTGETVWAGGVVGGIGSGQIIWVDCGLQ